MFFTIILNDFVTYILMYRYILLYFLFLETYKILIAGNLFLSFILMS